MSYLLCYIFENVVYSTHIFSQLTVFPVYVINYYITLSLEANMYLATFFKQSRVVHQAQGERNFHIFYHLLSGASDELLGKLFCNYSK